MAYRKIKLVVADAIATVTLSDPATLNAAALDMVEELIDVFRALAGNEAVRAVILTGEGRGFCSGANLSDPAPWPAAAAAVPRTSASRSKATTGLSLNCCGTRPCPSSRR
jgi:2-(1,2-epoxy-1,2-dihydrophenyl)acetyl-CoA isomerase